MKLQQTPNRYVLKSKEYLEKLFLKKIWRNEQKSCNTLLDKNAFRFDGYF